MYSNTNFGQLLKGLSRRAFDQQVEMMGADKFCKGFSSWSQFVAMVFTQLSGVRSLRELESAFNAQTAHHYHLGSGPIKRSTLADANAKRSSDLFASVCNQLIKSAHRSLRQELSDMLYLLDSSPIVLKGLGFDDWIPRSTNNRTQGLKLHVMIEGQGKMPVFAKMTGAKTSDIKVGREIALESGATYVFDMGYCDYNWWHKIDSIQSTFVTRLKKNANIKIIEQQSISGDEPQILEDALITMNNRWVKGRSEKNEYYGKHLRRIIVDRPDKETPMVVVTNNFELSAAEVADLYKKRWGIELYFKWIKQNLKIKSFLGRNENAVKTQIYTAIVSYLLLYISQQKQSGKMTIKLCLSALRVSLFQREETEQMVEYRSRQRREYLEKIQPQLAF